MTKLKKISFILFSIILISIAFYVLYSGKSKNNRKSAAKPALNIVNAQDSSIINIIAVGDVMLGTNYPNDNTLAPNDGQFLLEAVKPYFKNRDIVFANLEGCVLDEGGIPKKCDDSSTCYRFRMPTRYLNYLKEAGFNLVSNANNHVGDFGEPGRNATKENLAKSGIYFAGLESKPYTFFTVKGVKIGFAAFAANEGTIRITDLEKCKEIIKIIADSSDIAIVSFHGGGEGKKFRNLTKENEIFLDENRGNPVLFAHTAIDLGADIVIGHGPHVTRAMEFYKDKPIFYSLGNFCTYGKFNLSGPNGIAPILDLNFNRKGDFVSGKVYSIKQLGKGGPKFDEKSAALNEIINLSKEDFPNNLPCIFKNGEIKANIK